MRKFKFFKNESREFPWLVPYSWEQRPAKELCSIGTGKSNTQDQTDDGEYPFFIRSDIPVKSNKYLYDCEAVITIGDGNIGKVFHYVNGKFDLHQRCYKMIDFKDVTGRYFYYFFATKFYDRAMKMTAKATVDSVRLEMISEMDISYPPSPTEQRKIALFFCDLDRLITLHQRKHFYVFPKTGAFHNEKTNAWEQRAFSKTFSMLPNNTLSRAELDYEQGFAKNVHYGDVLIKFGECLDISCEVLPLIADAKKAEKYKSSALQTGDVVFADTAEDETVGKCSEIIGLQGETVVSGLHTIPCRPLLPFASGYLGYYMNSDSFHHQLLPLMQGIKVTSISKSALQTTEVIYPGNDKEQEKIGSYFRTLNSLITLHQRKPLFLFLEELRC